MKRLMIVGAICFATGLGVGLIGMRAAYWRGYWAGAEEADKINTEFNTLYVPVKP